jgi:hypothetical protein
MPHRYFFNALSPFSILHLNVKQSERGRLP